MGTKSRAPHTSAGRRAKAHALGSDQLRQHIAADAARIMAEEGVRDFQMAKHKAAERLGLPETKHLPDNNEINSALQQYLQLFHPQQLTQNVYKLRQLALEAMRFLAKFEPRLVGAVLSGVVTSTAAIELHIIADTPEEVGFWLQEHSIPYEQSDRRLRFGDERHENFPSYHFAADNVPIELCVFTRRKAREVPLSPVDGKPMKRAALHEVEDLVNKQEHVNTR